MNQTLAEPKVAMLCAYLRNGVHCELAEGHEGQHRNFMGSWGRWRITWAGRQLALIDAPTADAAIGELLKERGYGYLTAEVLTAEEVPSALEAELVRAEEAIAEAVCSVHGHLTAGQVERAEDLRRRVGKRWDAVNRRWMPLEEPAPPCWHCGGEGFHHLDCETLDA